MSASRKLPDEFFLGRFLGLAEVLRENPTHTDWVLKELLVIKDEYDARPAEVSNGE